MNGIGLRNAKRRRTWKAATEKLEAEGNTCRNCGKTYRVERAHVIGREHDYEFPVRNEDWQPGDVAPDRIIPLCGPSTDPNTCHGKQHFKRLDVLRLLTLPEQIQAVADCNGILDALYRLCPSMNPKKVDHERAA